MSIITLPAGLRQGAGGGMGQARFDTVSQSDSSGSQQVRLLAPPRWTMRLVQPPNLTQTDAAAWQALALQLRGRVNVLAAWDNSRPAPLGSARGSLVTSGTTAAGATSLVITGATHKNLLSYPAALAGAGWVNTGGTVTSNTDAAPDGTVSADTVVTTIGSVGIFQYVTVVPGTTYTFSFNARRSATTSAAYWIINNIDLTNVVARTSYYAAINATSWVRVSVTFTVPAGCTQIRAYPCASDGSTASGAILWGCQLEVGTLTDYAAAPTLRAGDWLQVGTGLGTSHYCMVTADAQATDAGVLTVAIEPPTRATFSGGTAVAWDKPLAYYRQQTDATTWSMAPGGVFGPLVTGLSLDLMETWQ